MRELAKSLMSYGWAVSIYGAQQMANLLTMRGETSSNAREIEELTANVVGKLGSNARTAYSMANDLQRAALDMLPGGSPAASQPAAGCAEEGTPASAYSDPAGKN